MVIGNRLSLFLAGQRRIKGAFSGFLPEVAFVPMANGLELGVDPLDRRGPSFHMAKGYRNPELALSGYEPTERKLISESLKAKQGSPVFLDVGANIGLFTFPLLKELPQLRVFAFEPHPRNARCFRETVQRNFFSNVSLEQAALGGADGESFLFVDESDSGGHSILEDNLWNNKQDTDCVKVPLLKLDTFVGQKNLERIDLLKIDVQGAEDEVLRGGMESLRKFRPDFLIEAQHEKVAGEGAIVNEIGNISSDYRFRTMESSEWLPLEELKKISARRFSEHSLFADYFFSVG